MTDSAPVSRRCIDLSHVIENGMMTYRGLPAPVICDYMSREQSRERYESGTEFHIGRIDMVANTGTYIDSPFHRYPTGRDIADLPLDDLVDIDCVVVSITQVVGPIGPHWFAGKDMRGKAVLVHTGWDEHWRTDSYFENHPHLTEASAVHLAEQGVVLVGIDSFNIDSTVTGARPVHTVLLGKGIPIVEHMCNLGELPLTGSRLTVVPVAVRGMGSFPVRPFAITAG